MDKKVDITFVGNGDTAGIFRGSLNAWSGEDVDGRVWFDRFANQCLCSIGNRFLPVYRMADGEFSFLVGRNKYNFRGSAFRYYLAVMKSLLFSGGNFGTIWGESYTLRERMSLRNTLIAQIAEISRSGYLAMFISDNGLFACDGYQYPIIDLFKKEHIVLDSSNYVPFYFACHLFVSDFQRDLLGGRRILFVSSLDEKRVERIRSFLIPLRPRSVEFLQITPSKSLLSVVDLREIKNYPDICLVSAGIGSSNILLQLRSLGTLAVDIGSFIGLLDGTMNECHGGVFRMPVLRVEDNPT